jgi:bla regulator protein blaR1
VILEVAGNHLWQSTLFVGAIAGLVWTLRSNRAGVRHALWVLASAKFLVPGSLLAASVANWNLWPAPATQVPIESWMFSVVEPLSSSPSATGGHGASATEIAGSSPFSWTMVLLWTWATGSVWRLTTFAAAWRAASAHARGAVTLRAGREYDILQRVCRRYAVRRRIRLVAPLSKIQPGVFGLRRVTLLLPQRVADRLDDDELEAVIAHEVAHVRRGDLVVALLHTTVEVLFWFHPAVWWIGGRLLAERERACDEAVVRAGVPRQTYAATILKLCALAMERPLVCMSGNQGPTLNRRMEVIMTNNFGQALGVGKKLLIGSVVGAAALAGFAVLIHQEARAAAAPLASLGSRLAEAPVPMPEIAERPRLDLPATQSNVPVHLETLQPSTSGRWGTVVGIETTGRIAVTHATARALIQSAYQLEEHQIVDAPAWTAEERFDVVARVLGLSSPAGPELLRPVLQTLLTERFGLQMHQEVRELAVYALSVDGDRVATGLRRTTATCAADPQNAGPGGPVDTVQRRGGLVCGLSFAPGTLVAGDAPLSWFASAITRFVGRPVVDRTGLAGTFDIDLTWTPNPLLASPPPGAPPFPPIDPLGPSIFVALKEQLGLRLQPERALVDVVVIDRIERP